MSSGGRPTLRAVLNFADAVDFTRRRLGDESTLISARPNQMARDVPELRGKILMNKEDMHSGLFDNACGVLTQEEAGTVQRR